MTVPGMRLWEMEEKTKVWRKETNRGTQETDLRVHSFNSEKRKINEEIKKEKIQRERRGINMG